MANPPSTDMRLADFILENIEPILAEWEIFAKTVWPGTEFDSAALRDHASDILRSTARDMQSAQTPTEQSDKSKGSGAEGAASERVDQASDVHALARVRSGFHMLALVAEYRALRASVIRLWRTNTPAAHAPDLDDLTRFNESIDQSLTVAIRTYTERVDRSRKMFLAILGHDLRNPLNSILMSAQLQVQTPGLDPDFLETSQQIVTSAEAMRDMINDLLDFTGTGLGAALHLSPAPMDLGLLCNEVVNELRRGHPTRTLIFEPRGNLQGVWDAGRLRHVVSNLLSNALQHGDGPVTCSATGEGSGVEVTIHNGGLPIPPDALPTIFDPLVRGESHPSPKRRRRGSIGLGLYIAREVVTAHGGTIDVKSTPAEGTLFTVHLPRQR